MISQSCLGPGQADSISSNIAESNFTVRRKGRVGPGRKGDGEVHRTRVKRGRETGSLRWRARDKGKITQAPACQNS